MNPAQEGGGDSIVRPLPPDPAQSHLTLWRKCPQPNVPIRPEKLSKLVVIIWDLNNHLLKFIKKASATAAGIVCYTAVFRVTQRSSPLVGRSVA